MSGVKRGNLKSAKELNSSESEKLKTTSQQFGNDCVTNRRYYKRPLTSSISQLDKAKSTCTELGFTLGTEKHGDCVLKMMDN